jgi:hypothetical protein
MAQRFSPAHDVETLQFVAAAHYHTTASLWGHLHTSRTRQAGHTMQSTMFLGHALPGRLLLPRTSAAFVMP